MQFKVGDKVVLTNIAKWYDGDLKRDEECVITSIGWPYSSFDPIIRVRSTGGIAGAIYSSWVSKPKLKNQQLLFDFMD